MDITLIKELTKNLLYINDKFNLNEEDATIWQDLYNNVIDFPIVKDNNGNILYMEEWIDDVAQGDLGHRHISHIYGIFPGKLFFEKGNEELKEAAIKALYRRRQNGFGSCATWSHAWYACCFSRIGAGDESLKSINDLMETGMINNFLTTHNDWRDGGDKSSRMIKFKLFQIEAVLGAATAICEIFLQSYEDYIHILPSLPQKWYDSGYIKGMRAYGNLEFDIYWKNGEVEKLYVKSNSEGIVKIKIETSSNNILINDQKIELKDGFLKFKYYKNSIKGVKENYEKT